MNILIDENGKIDWTAIGSICGGIALIVTIIPYIREWYINGVIELKLDKQINITVDQINSVMTLRIGVTCKNKDVFIEKSTLEITHSNGHKKSYVWGLIGEVLWENRGDNGNFSTQKQSFALGWKFIKDTVTDPAITFIDPEYAKKVQSYKDHLFAKSYALQDNNQDLNLLKTDTNYTSLLQLYKENCQWLSGNYKGVVSIHTVDNKTYDKSFSFTLDKLSIDYFKDVVYDILVERTQDTFIEPDRIIQEGEMKRMIKNTFVPITQD